MTVSLDDAWDKLRWAKHHLEVLRDQIEPFEQRDMHTFRVEVDQQAGKYEFYVTGLQVPDPDWGLMIGDCLHNARTALDYIAVHLWALVTGAKPEDVTGIDFPIYDDPQGPPRSISIMAKELGFSGYLATIQSLQTFNAYNPSIWGVVQQPPGLPFALKRLSVLDNIDKHRVIHATWLGLSGFSGWFTIDKDAPDSFQPIAGGTTLKPLEDGAKVADYTFVAPLPEQWEPSQVQMKGYFPLRVAFPDPSPVKAVLEILPWSVSAVEAVLQIFSPVFEHGGPPLPVTAVTTIRG
jgi:hypothetical protein